MADMDLTFKSTGGKAGVQRNHHDASTWYSGDGLNGAPVLSGAKRSRRKAVERLERFER